MLLSKPPNGNESTNMEDHAIGGNLKCPEETLSPTET